MNAARTPREPWLAVFLSWNTWGLGQVYAGHVVRGVVLLLAGSGATVGGALWGASPSGNVFAGVSLFVLGLLLGFVAAWDAHRCASRANPPEFETARRQSKDPWLALFLSTLLPGMGHLYLRKWGWAALMGVLLGLSVLAYARVGWGEYALLLVLLLAAIHAYRCAPARHRLSARALAGIALLVLALRSAAWFGPALFVQHVAEPFKITANSMSPTLRAGERFLAWKPGRLAPRHGDVVLFEAPEQVQARLKSAQQNWVSRTVALGGETVEIRDSILYVDGVLETETALGPAERKFEFVGEATPYVVPAGHVFVIGDNTSSSFDSRYFGAISGEAVKGRVTGIFWPLSRMGSVQ